jgi:putative radical SAM enzyme (TIGR03279 family)
VSRVRKNAGVTIRSISRDSSFFKGGLRKGDRILRINGEQLYSELDFHYFVADDYLFIEIERKNKLFTLEINRYQGDFTGITLVEQPIHRCTNRCIFCFIDQMPPGLRKSLYIKDEDIRLSVINGNYVTLSNFSRQDLKNIVRIGLSPLYISVHTTDATLRERMLQNCKAAPIMEQLIFLASNKIQLHTQIVVCPSHNDGLALKKTIADLLTLNDSLQSVAIVPVGLTRYRKQLLQPVDRKNAAKICRMVSRVSDRQAQKNGARKIFLADEFYIKAKLPIPELNYYEDFPQIENGVGLVRQLIDSWQKVKPHLLRQKKPPRGIKKKKRLLVVTSVSAYPFIQEIVDELEQVNSFVSIEVVAVTNSFFGESVTVAGLLTATDIVSQVRRKARAASFEKVVLPSVILNYAGYTLDGFSPQRIQKAIGISVHVVDSVEELANL